MNNYIVINGERFDLVNNKGCDCNNCKLRSKCEEKKLLCEIFCVDIVFGSIKYHFIKRQYNL